MHGPVGFIYYIQNSYTERNMNYDRNGNILSLERTQAGSTVNDFAYSYDGNKLVSLTDEGDEGVAASGSSAGSVYTYAYDSNGNMTYDGANDLDLTYNHLNLIEKVAQNGVTLANYSYLADGTKLSATDADGNGLVYAGSLVYRKQNGNLSLESGAFPEGRFVATDSGIETHYHLTDHLGSVRAVVDGATGEVVETNDYYPFGMRWQDPNQMTADNRYRYNAKEEQNFLNLPFIDYGWRQYDAKIVRWNGLDRLVWDYVETTPFAFCLNNPIRHIDSDGRKVRIWYQDQQGRDQSYLYSGGKSTVNNTFVSQVVEAYQYNKDNTGGTNPMTKAVEGDAVIGILQTNNDNKYWSVTKTVYWNPALGLETINTVLSPATSVDHEFDHAVDDAISPQAHEKRSNTTDTQYDTQEERRVITGSEQRTARANGETKNGQPTRQNHRGRDVVVDGGVKSTRINQTKTQEYEKRQQEIQNDSRVQWPEW